MDEEILLEFPKQISKNDIKRKIKFPIKLTRELAEEIGIHVGDGCLGIFKNDDSKKYSYGIYGGYDDESYFRNFVIPLMVELYNIKPSFYRAKNEHALALNYQSKGLVYFKQALGLPFGKKDSIEIPRIILKSQFQLDFIRGLFDTDGSLAFMRRHKDIRYYPVISASAKNPLLIEQLVQILKSYNLKVSMTLNSVNKASNGTLCKTSKLYISGKHQLEMWMKLIGTSNPKNISKYNHWKAFGYLPNDWKASDEI